MSSLGNPAFTRRTISACGLPVEPSLLGKTRSGGQSRSRRTSSSWLGHVVATMANSAPISSRSRTRLPVSASLRWASSTKIRGGRCARYASAIRRMSPEVTAVPLRVRVTMGNRPSALSWRAPRGALSCRLRVVRRRRHPHWTPRSQSISRSRPTRSIVRRDPDLFWQGRESGQVARQAQQLPSPHRVPIKATREVASGHGCCGA